MNTFYEKLTEFGVLVNRTSRAKKLDMANYFTVLHPSYPVFNHHEHAKPGIHFNERCPFAVKREIAGLWSKVFG